YAPDSPSGQHIAVAARTSAAASFGMPMRITELASAATDNDVTLSGDERVVVFASDRTGTRGMFYATRDAIGTMFTKPVELAARAQLRERDRAVQLGELAAIFEQQEVMAIAWRRQAEQALQQHLGRSARRDVVAAHDVGDRFVAVVDDDCELIGDHAVAPPHD